MKERWLRGGPPASETEVLGLLDSLFVSRTPHTPLGRGHDCAELANLEGRLALSTDMFWQDSHFRLEYFTPGEAGGKALSSAVSDLAAAGATPLGFSLDLLLPAWLGMDALKECLAGMAAKAREFGIVLAGGDVAKGRQLGFSLTVWGAPVTPESPFLRRGRARPGDLVFLVGEAGLARVGLLELERSGRDALRDFPLACAAHLEPRPLLAEGQALALLAGELAGEPVGQAAIETAGQAGASLSRQRPGLALMDLSDGLARDLPRLLGPYGVDLSLAPRLFPEEVCKAASLLGLPPEQIFLLGGEDYALLGSCAEALWPRVSSAVPGARIIGRVREEPGLFLDRQPVVLDGFDHFASPSEEGQADPFAAPVVAEAVRTIIRTGREAWEAGLMAGFNGNISCRIAPHAADPAHTAVPAAPANRAGKGAGGCGACLITRSGSAKSRLEPGDFALVALADGELLAGSAASSELGLHLGVYRVCPGSAVILHCHPPRLLALSLLLPPEERLVLPLPEAENYRKRLVCVPYFPPGSAELAEAVADAAKGGSAVWMERHGLVAHGPDAASVISLTEELEQLALVHLQTLGR